jgi:hypothetical protein
MSSKIEIVKAFIQYGVLSPDSIKSRNSNHLEQLIDQGMKKINANLLLMNIPETGYSPFYDTIDITPEVIYETLQEFGSPIEVLHHCKYVYVALVEDPQSCADQLSGNKIGKNTIKVVAYNSTNSSGLPHERLNIYFPTEQVESEDEEVEDQNMMSGSMMSGSCVLFAGKLSFLFALIGICFVLITI